VHFREILSGYFLFSGFDWSIFVTQLVAKHMKEIIFVKLSITKKILQESIIFSPPKAPAKAFRAHLMQINSNKQL
jgi:hypothetical protein